MIQCIKEKENIEQIKKKYPNEWLLLIDCETDKMSSPVSGVLVEHSKNRDEIYKKLRKYSGKLCIEYSGKIPKDLAVMFSI